MKNEKQETRIIIYPWLNGDSFIVLVVLALFIPMVIIGMISTVVQKTVGPYIEPIYKAYYTVIISPLILIFKPETWATSFGAVKLSENQIQEFYNRIIVSPRTSQMSFMALYFALFSLIIILLYCYKHGIIKGKINWISRYVILNVFVTVPLWYYLIDIVGKAQTTAYKFEGHYTNIYKVMQQQIIDTYKFLLITAIGVTFIGHWLIYFAGRNKHKKILKRELRSKRREEKSLIKQKKLIERMNKKTEYY